MKKMDLKCSYCGKMTFDFLNVLEIIHVWDSEMFLQCTATVIFDIGAICAISST